MTKAGIEVFQDLTLVPGPGAAGEIRTALLGQPNDIWQHSPDTEADIRSHASGADVIQFIYQGTEFPKAGLTLWERDGRYAVTNIVPADIRELDVSQYNALLQDFVRHVVEPSQAEAGFTLELTEPVRALDTWISAEAAEALRRFSALANKSTTNSHPMDANRWEEFVVAVHREDERLNTEVLRQWLVEIDGWDDRSASKLVIDYEKGLSLLRTYDRLLGA